MSPFVISIAKELLSDAKKWFYFVSNRIEAIAACRHGIKWLINVNLNLIWRTMALRLQLDVQRFISQTHKATATNSKRFSWRATADWHSAGIHKSGMNGFRFLVTHLIGCCETLERNRIEQSNWTIQFDTPNIQTNAKNTHKIRQKTANAKQQNISR